MFLPRSSVLTFHSPASSLSLLLSSFPLSLSLVSATPISKGCSAPPRFASPLLPFPTSSLSLLSPSPTSLPPSLSTSPPITQPMYHGSTALHMPHLHTLPPLLSPSSSSSAAILLHCSPPPPPPSYPKDSRTIEWDQILLSIIT